MPVLSAVLMNRSLRISVVIPVLNEEQLIGSAIDSAWLAGADEVIVCDGGSTDNTLSAAGRRDCHIVNSATGRGYQLAAGCHVATGDLLVFLHADCQFSDQCLQQIRQLPNEPVWGCFEQRIDREGRRFRWLEKGNRWRARVRKVVYGDQAMWVTRQAYDRAGGFADVPLMEDVLLSDALRKIAAPVVLPGPLTIPSRHWHRKGVVRTTARNWLLFGMFRCGVPADRIAKLYR